MPAPMPAPMPKPAPPCADACRAVFPAGKRYRVIYADPPWRYERACLGALPYPSMSLDELKALPVADIAAPDAALFLWTSNSQLQAALELLGAWGFSYRTVFKVWSKRHAPSSKARAASIEGAEPLKVACLPGFWSLSSVELLLVATRGCLQKFKRVFNEPQEFAGARGAHSEKPREIRDSIERLLDAGAEGDMVNGGGRIELFARHVCDGWDAWGLDVPNYLVTSAARRVSEPEVTQRVVCFLDCSGPGGSGRAVRLLHRVVTAVSRGTQNPAAVAATRRAPAKAPGAAVPDAKKAADKPAAEKGRGKPAAEKGAAAGSDNAAAPSSPAPRSVKANVSVAQALSAADERVPVIRVDNGVHVKGLARPPLASFARWWHRGRHRATGVPNRDAYRVPEWYLEARPEVRRLQLPQS